MSLGFVVKKGEGDFYGQQADLNFLHNQLPSIGFWMFPVTLTRSDMIVFSIENQSLQSIAYCVPGARRVLSHIFHDRITSDQTAERSCHGTITTCLYVSIHH